jgi:hypothetical protein
MSWKLGFVIVGNHQTADEIFAALGVKMKHPPRVMPLADALEPTAQGAFAVQSEDSYTLVLNRLLPYDLSFAPPFESALEVRLKRLSKSFSVLAGFVDGSSATAGFIVFERGEMVRARKIVSGEVEEDHGALLDEEKKAKRGEESRIFAVTGRWLGMPLDDLFFESEKGIEVYET